MKDHNRCKIVFKEIIKEEIQNIENQLNIEKRTEDKVNHIFKVVKNKEDFLISQHFYNFQKESFQILVVKNLNFLQTLISKQMLQHYFKR